MARAISVKVATAKVIKSLEDKIAQNTQAIEANKVIDLENEKAKKAHLDLILNSVPNLVVDNAYVRWNNSLEVSYKLPDGEKFPEFPNSKPRERELGAWEVEEINNAIRILKMTDEEFVNASTFKSIAQYL